MKTKFDIITSTCVPLPLENVDTDQIMKHMVKMMLIPRDIRWISSWWKVVPIWRHIGSIVWA